MATEVEATQPLWRLEQLAQQGQALLDQLHWADGGDGRVRWEPNTRLLRYYTTLGLLDRASFMSGRTAYYGRRHLLQLLAVKRLQQQGHSLQQIQQRLLGLGAAQLEALLELKPDWHAQLTPDTEGRGRFWEQVEQLPRVPVARALLEVELAPGVRLQIDPEVAQLDAQLLQQLRHQVQSFITEKENHNRD